MAIKKKRNSGAQMNPAVLLSVEHPTNVPAQTRNQEMGLHFVLSRRNRKLTSVKAQLYA